MSGNHSGLLKNGRRVGPVRRGGLRRAGPPENRVIEDGGPALEASWSQPTRDFQQSADGSFRAALSAKKLSRGMDGAGVLNHVGHRDCGRIADAEGCFDGRQLELPKTLSPAFFRWKTESGSVF